MKKLFEHSKVLRYTAAALLLTTAFSAFTGSAIAVDGNRERNIDPNMENNGLAFYDNIPYNDNRGKERPRLPEWNKGKVLRPDMRKDSLRKALADAAYGDTIELTQPQILDSNIEIDCAVRITGADKLDDSGFVISLVHPDAAITSDGELNMASGLEGYAAIREEDTYILREIAAPGTAATASGSKVEKIGEVRYLFLDLDPNGVALNDFCAGVVFADLSAYTLRFDIEGNDGTALIKTSDRLTVTACNADGNVVASISYVVIVMGDTNCNGIVNTSDVVGMKSASFSERGIEVQLAADTNLSGVAAPKVNSSDAVYIMNKCFMWEADKYVSNLN